MLNAPRGMLGVRGKRKLSRNSNSNKMEQDEATDPILSKEVCPVANNEVLARRRLPINAAFFN